MVQKLAPMEMFADLIERGYVTPATIDPAGWMMPTAYISVPTSTVFVTPPIENSEHRGVAKNAELGSRTQRNPKRKGRAKR